MKGISYASEIPRPVQMNFMRAGIFQIVGESRPEKCRFIRFIVTLIYTWFDVS